jgi:hypothetical protein
MPRAPAGYSRGFFGNLPLERTRILQYILFNTNPDNKALAC